MALINAKSRFKNAATKAGLGLAAIATAMTPMTAANAMVRGDTATPEVMARHLKAEGQEVVALANKEVINRAQNRVDLYATAFTCSSDGSHGYVVVYDTPLGTVPTQSKVLARTQNCEIFNIDNRVSDVSYDQRVYDEQEIEQKCDELLKNDRVPACGSYQQAIRNSQEMGERIAYRGANSNAIDRSNFYVQGHFTMTASNEGQSAALWYTSEEGATILYDTYRDFSYSSSQQSRFSNIAPQISMK